MGADKLIDKTDRNKLPILHITLFVNCYALTDITVHSDHPVVMTGKLGPHQGPI